jgi:hypothetical protein
MPKQAVWLKLDAKSKVRVRVAGKKIEIRLSLPIDRIRRQANECRSRIVIPPEKVDVPPKQCPNGHNWDWNVPTDSAAFTSAFPQFFNALKKLCDPVRQNASGFKIFLELEEIE